MENIRTFVSYFSSSLSFFCLLTYFCGSLSSCFSTALFLFRSQVFLVTKNSAIVSTRREVRSRFSLLLPLVVVSVGGDAYCGGMEDECLQCWIEFQVDLSNSSVPCTLRRSFSLDFCVLSLTENGRAVAWWSVRPSGDFLSFLFFLCFLPRKIHTTELTTATQRTESEASCWQWKNGTTCCWLKFVYVFLYKLPNVPLSCKIHSYCLLTDFDSPF